MEPDRIFEVAEDISIKRYQIPSRLTSVERRLMKHFSNNKALVVCVGNIGAGKSSLVKYLAYNTGMNALFELPDEGFEDHVAANESLYPLLATAKDAAKRTLGRYYSAINEFIECQQSAEPEGPRWLAAKKNLEMGALDIQHAYLDLRRMQLQAVPYLEKSTCIDGSAFADRYAFCEVLHRDMDVSYLTKEAIQIIDERLKEEFRPLKSPDLLIILEAPEDYLFQNIRDRQRIEEKASEMTGDDGIPEGLSRLVRNLNRRYGEFVEVIEKTGWYDGPVLRIDVSKIDFVSNVRHLIAVYEGIEKLVCR
jgi:deoxyadenosine/deoxycytidine kinase